MFLFLQGEESCLPLFQLTANLTNFLVMAQRGQIGQILLVQQLQTFLIQWLQALHAQAFLIQKGQVIFVLMSSVFGEYFCLGN